MSRFEKFMGSAERFCKKAVNKTAEITDITASAIKIKAEEARLCERYEELGKCAEDTLRAMDVLPREISSILDKITEEKEKIKELKAELAEKKAKSNEEKSEKADSEEGEENEHN